MKCRKHKVEKIKTHSYFPYREHWTCMECINDMLIEDNKRKALLKSDHEETPSRRGR